MPYIKSEQRNVLKISAVEFARAIKIIAEEEMKQVDGYLNFVICTMLYELYKEQPGYSKLNQLMGTMNCASLEFYRRVGVPYEDVKCKVNGDVFIDEKGGKNGHKKRNKKANRRTK